MKINFKQIDHDPDEFKIYDNDFQRIIQKEIENMKKEKSSFPLLNIIRKERIEILKKIALQRESNKDKK